MSELAALLVGAGAALIWFVALPALVERDYPGRPAGGEFRSSNWIRLNPSKAGDRSVSGLLRSVDGVQASGFVIEREGADDGRDVVALPWGSLRYEERQNRDTYDWLWSALGEIELNRGDRLWFFDELGPGYADLEISRVSERLLMRHIQYELKPDSPLPAPTRIRGESGWWHGESEEIRAVFKIDDVQWEAWNLAISQTFSRLREEDHPARFWKLPKMADTHGKMTEFDVEFPQGLPLFIWESEKDRNTICRDPATGWVYYHYEYEDTGI